MTTEDVRDTTRRRALTQSRVAQRAGAVLAVLAAFVGASVAVAAPASAINADSYISSNSGGANMRECPNTGCGSVLYLSNGTAVHMLCYSDSQTVSPPNSNYASARWFRVGLHYNNNNGYVHSSLVTKQTNVPRC